MTLIEEVLFWIGAGVVVWVLGTVAILAGAFALAYWLERRR